MCFNQGGVFFAVQHGTRAYTLVNAYVERGDYFVTLTLPLDARKGVVGPEKSAIDRFVETELANLRDDTCGLSVVENGHADVGYIFPNPAKCRWMQEHPSIGTYEAPVLISLSFEETSKLEGLVRLVSNAHVKVNPLDLAREVIVVHNKLLTSPKQHPVCAALQAYLKQYYIPLLEKVARVKQT